MKLIVFDVEATGLSHSQICQLAYLMIDGENVRGKNMYFTVDDMNEAAFQIHGLSREKLDALSGGARFADRAAEIMNDFAQAELLVGHNVSADRRYLNEELKRLNLPAPNAPSFCTMNRFTQITRLRRIGNRSFKPPRLEELTEHYGLSSGCIAERAGQWFGDSMAAHDARWDAAAAWLCVLEAVARGDIPHPAAREEKRP